jgi:type I restriction enzyme R subunit
MSKLTESAIEDLAIELFVRHGYQYLYGPDIAPDSDASARNRYDEVLLSGRLEQALSRINPSLAPEILQTALKEVQRIQSPDLLTNNESFHRLLTEGVKVSSQRDGNERGELV